LIALNREMMYHTQIAILSAAIKEAKR